MSSAVVKILQFDTLDALASFSSNSFEVEKKRVCGFVQGVNLIKTAFLYDELFPL